MKKAKGENRRRDAWHEACRRRAAGQAAHAAADECMREIELTRLALRMRERAIRAEWLLRMLAFVAGASVGLLLARAIQ